MTKLFNRSADTFDNIFLVLAALMIPMLFLEYSYGVSSFVGNLFRLYYIFIWIAFAVEFLVRIKAAKSKEKYIAQNWIEIVIILFPILRIFRVVRVFEIALLVFLDRFSKIFPPLRRHSFFNLLILIFVVIGISSELILQFEKSFPDSAIKTFSDALWWSTVGVSTIGIGNVVPVSIAGRYLTLFLMITGVFVFSVFTANIAAMFAEDEVREDVNRDLKIMEGDLNKVEKDIASEIAVDDSKIEKKLQEMENRLDKIDKK